MTNQKFLACLCVSAVTAGLLLSVPARAEDDKTVGILAGLGVAAASGKTTLGGGAGAIEAGLLGTENFQQAGAIIAGVVNRLGKGRPVLVVTHDEKVDLASSQLLLKRLGQVQTLVNRCTPAPTPLVVANPAGGGSPSYKFMPGKPLASDFVGAGLTDVGISGIALTADDRLLIAALIMNSATAEIESKNEWVAAPAKFGVGPHADYRSTADLAGVPASGSAIGTAYDGLVATMDVKRSVCSQTDAGKAVLATADALVNGLNAAGATGVPLVNAIQAEQLATGNPHVLRLAIEQVGGTSIARSGILYTFGWPNAATVAGGLLVSFRLTDPASGKIEALGLVRCMMGQSNIKHVADVLRHDPRAPQKPAYAMGQSSCDYRVWQPPA